MRENIVKGDFHILDQRQFNANFCRECRRRKYCSTFIEHTVCSIKTRETIRKQCEFGPSRKQILLSASRRVFAFSPRRASCVKHVDVSRYSRKLYFRPSNENVQKIVLARYRVSDIRTRTDDESKGTR